MSVVTHTFLLVAVVFALFGCRSSATVDAGVVPQDGGSCGGAGASICTVDVDCPVGSLCKGGCCLAGPTPRQVWMRQIGAAGLDHSRALAIDASGDIVIGGGFSDTVDFGAAGLTADGTRDAFLVRYAADGSVQWAVGHGGPGLDFVQDVRWSGGDLFVQGVVDPAADLGCGPITAPLGFRSYLARYAAADGRCVWAIAPPSNNIFGMDTAEPDALVLTGGTTRGGLLVARRDFDGQLLWERTFGDGGGGNWGYQVATSTSGRIATLASLTGTVDFDGTLVDFSARSSLAVVVLDAAGRYQWSRILQQPTDGVVSGNVAVDSSGAVIVVGTLKTPFDLGGGLVAIEGSSDGFVAKYAADGQYEWAVVFGGAGADGGAVVSVDENDIISLVGIYQGTIDLGWGPLREVPDSGAFLARYWPDGTLLWSTDFAGELYPCANRLAGAGDLIAVVGEFDGTKRCAGEERTSAGEFDVIVGMYRLE